MSIAALALVLATGAISTSGGDVAFRGGWTADAAWVATGLALQGGARVLERSLEEPSCPCDPVEVPPFDHWALGRDRRESRRYSDGGRNTLIYGAPLLAAAAVPGSVATRAQAALVVGESILVTAGVTNIAKAVALRPRPYAYDADPGEDLGPEAFHSMPSGHTSYSFAAATGLVTVLHQRRPGWRATPWIAAGAYSVAAATAFWRVDAGVHFPSDVLAGAALGTGVGWIVAHSREMPVAIVTLRNGVGIAGRF